MFSVKSIEFLLMTLAGYCRLQKTGKHYGINELLIFYKKKKLREELRRTFCSECASLPIL